MNAPNIIANLEKDLQGPIQYPDAERYPNLILRENYELLNAYLQSLHKNAESPEKIQAARGALQHALLAAEQRSFRSLDFGEWRRRLQQSQRLDGQPEKLSESRIDVIFDFMRPMCRWLIRRRRKAFRHWDEDRLSNIAIGSDAPDFGPVLSRPMVTLEKALEIANLDIDANPVLMRDRAVACLQWASGARVESIATLPLKAFTFDDARIQINMDPKLGVKTKGGKAIKTTLLPIPMLLSRVIAFYDWLKAKGATDDAMFFNALIEDAEGNFTASNAKPAPTRAHTLAKRYQSLYQLLDWQDFSGTHGFRRGHITYALACTTTTQNSLAVCKNVGHNLLATTFAYNQQDDDERASMITRFTPELFHRLNDGQAGGNSEMPVNAARALDMVEEHIRATTTDPKNLKHLLRDIEGLRESLE